MEFFNVNWDIINFNITLFLNKIKNESFDLIVPIARGGLVPGTAISYKAKIPNVYPLHLKSYNDNNKQEEIKFLNKPDLEYLCNNFSKSNILIFDDLSDTGKTLQYAAKFFDYNLNAAKVKTGTLYIKHGTAFIPDIYVQELSNDLWVNFPWE